MDYIKIEDLKDGYLYHIDARNATYGIWISKRESFLISRTKFYDNFLFEECHWDCPAFATAKPIQEIEKSPFDPDDIEIVNTEGHFGYKEEDGLLRYLNEFEGAK